MESAPQDSLLTDATAALKSLDNQTTPGSGKNGGSLLKELLTSSPRPPDRPVPLGSNPQGCYS